jgi:retron-type reverse transcriptase
VRRPVTGTAQGGVISPLMCNVYLHRLDRAWRGAYGTLVRYADLCRARHKSAYAEDRVMPTRLPGALVRAVSGLPLSA